MNAEEEKKLKQEEELKRLRELMNNKKEELAKFINKHVKLM